VYAATDWSAVFELGIPAAVVGASLGFVAGGIAEWLKAMSGTRRPGIDSRGDALMSTWRTSSASAHRKRRCVARRHLEGVGRSAQQPDTSTFAPLALSASLTRFAAEQASLP
jgi:hypothetical protein